MIAALAEKSGALLGEGAGLAAGVSDFRLACEIGAIIRLARANVGRLLRRDPLGERVHPTIARPRGPDFSGWHCTPKVLPDSRMAV